MLVPPTYLSIADRQMEALTNTPAGFVKSMIYRVLFCREKLLIPDIYFFISKQIAKHVLNDGGSHSFLATCIEKGHVIPAFRQSTEIGFLNARKEIQTTDIQGVRKDTAEEVALALEVAADRAVDFKYKVWPGDLGLGFQHDLYRLLVTPDMPPTTMEVAGLSQDVLNKIWYDTKKWRTECIPAALERTCIVAGQGIRRGAIMNAVAADIGFRCDRIDDIGDLIRFASNDPQMNATALETFFRWVCMCYYSNHANAFGCSPSFPRFDGLAAAIGQNLITGFATGDDDESQVQQLTLNLTVPAFSVLLSMNPTDLLDVRSHAGSDYFEALLRWESQSQNERDDDMRAQLDSRLKEAAKKYCDKLVIVAGARSTSPELTGLRLDHIVPSGRTRHSLGAVLKLLGDLFWDASYIRTSVNGIFNIISPWRVPTESIAVTHRTRMSPELTVAPKNFGATIALY